MRLFCTTYLFSLLVCYALTASTSAPSTSQQTTNSTSASPSSSTQPSTQRSSTSKQPSTTIPLPASTTITQTEECKRSNTSCDVCLKVGSGQCVWCACKNTCTLKTKVVPTTECDCGLSDTKWGVCWVNYEVLIIVCAVVGVLLLLGLTVCICCCCCCKGNNKAKYAREDAKTERKKADMKAAHSERRAERKAKTDEIRRKYGLIKEDNAYQRFDNA